MNFEEKTKIVKAAFIAGLKLYGMPSKNCDDNQIQYWAKEFDIDLTEFRNNKGNYIGTSGLIWYWDWSVCYITEMTFSAHVLECAECYGLDMKLNDFIEVVTTVVDSYAFNLKGEGFDGESFLNPKIWDNGCVYDYFDCEIRKIKIDLKTKEEIKRLLVKGNYINENGLIK